VAEEAVREANRELRQRKQNIRTEQEVAKELGCCVATVRSARKRHHVPHIVAGRLVRYTDEQFERLLQAMERPKLREAKPGSRAA
jgi:endonuclease III